MENNKQERASRKVNFSTDINTGSQIIYGVLLEANKPNVNGIVIPEDVLRKAVDEYNQRKRGKFVTVENGDAQTVDPEKIVAHVDKLDFDGEKVVVQAPILAEKRDLVFPTEGKVFNTISFADLKEDGFTVENQKINFIDVIEE